VTLFITAALVSSSLYTYTDAIFTTFPGLTK
jgi:type III secretory pathway component EscS